jgi:hypothetical protein
MDNDERIMEVVGIIALRKSIIFNKVMGSVTVEKKTSPSYNEKVKEYISDMKIEYFMTSEEHISKKINPLTRVDELHINVINLVKEIGV